MAREPAGRETSVDSLVRAVARAPRVAPIAPPVRIVPGTLVAGTFEILDELGRGGMGIVYRAHDRQLDREVAIKFVRTERWAHLPRAAVAELVEREARATARLQHPSIVTLYQAGEHEGALYLVLELLRGQNLASALRRPLPVPAALEVARAVADALVHAHAEGVLHRDLKPHNIFLGEHGQVWVLDFGLAALHEAGAEPGVAAMSRAGTPAYMAPEQRDGRAQDARTDVWALGLLLYQLVTAYEPPPLLAPEDLTRPPWTADLDRLPPEVAAVVRGAVRWAPADRFATAAAFRAALDAISAEAGRPARRRPGVRRALAAGAVIALGLGGLGAIRALDRRTASPAPPAVRFSIPLPATEPFATFQASVVAVAPDGRSIVHVGRPTDGASGAAQLYLRRFDEDVARPLADTVDAEGPFFSPDGRELGFAKDGALWRMPLAGGARVRLAAVRPGFRGGTWTRSGTIVYAPSWFSGLYAVPATGGEARPVTTLRADEKSHRFPHALPDGRTVLFVASTARTVSFDDAAIEAVDLITGARRAVTTGGAPRFVPPATLLVPRAGALVALRFDPHRLAVTGPATPVLDGLVTAPTIGVGAYDVTARGTLAYVPGGPDLFMTKVARVGRDGAVTLLPVPDRPATSVRVAPDGTLLIRADAANATIWRHDLGREIDSRITWSWDADHAVMAPAGDWVYLVITRGEESEIVRQRADGTGDYQAIWRGVAPANLELSRDGRILLFDDRDPTTGRSDLHWLALGRGEPAHAIAAPGHELQPALSPDGRWLAYTSDESDRDEIYVQGFPEPGLRVRISSHGGRAARWSPDGRSLWYRHGRAVMVVPIEAGDRLVAGRPELRFELDDVDDPARRTYDLLPDGSGLVTIVRAADWRPADALRVVLGWEPVPAAR